MEWRHLLADPPPPLSGWRHLWMVHSATTTTPGLDRQWACIKAPSKQKWRMEYRLTWHGTQVTSSCFVCCCCFWREHRISITIMPETRPAQGVDEEKILSKTNLKRAISASFSKFAIQSSKKHSSSSKMIYVIRSDKKKAEVQVTFFMTISFTNIWTKFPLGLQICIPTHIYLLHRKVGDTFHTGNNFRKRCGVKSTTTAISLFLVYICLVTYVWCRHDQNVSHFLLVYFDIIMIKKGYIISKKSLPLRPTD